jgi:hypothetical protein
MDAIKANSGRYKIEDAGINSLLRLWNYHLCKIVFASARDTGSLGTEDILGPATLQNCTDVGEMSLGSPAKFDKSINSKFNESTLFLLKMENHLFHKKQLSRGEERKRRE